MAVSPRINEKGGGRSSGCTEREIVFGGMVNVHTPFIVYRCTEIDSEIFFTYSLCNYWLGEREGGGGERG